MSFLKNFFGTKEPELPPVDLSVLKTDMHSHFIPGIDDGAKTLEESVGLIKELHQLGYKKLITTPHVISDSYRNTPEIIFSGLNKVKLALEQEKVPIVMEAAAEYYLDFEFEEKINKRELLTFGKNFVLFEVSLIVPPPKSFEAVVFNMVTSGYKPVLAHVERYPFWHADYEKYESMKNAGMLLQLNLNSLYKGVSPQIKKAAKHLIEQEMIDLVGTDCHNMNYIKILKDTLTSPLLHKLLSSGRLLNRSL